MHYFLFKWKYVQVIYKLYSKKVAKLIKYTFKIIKSDCVSSYSMFYVIWIIWWNNLMFEILSDYKFHLLKVLILHFVIMSVLRKLCLNEKIYNTMNWKNDKCVKPFVVRLFPFIKTH